MSAPLVVVGDALLDRDVEGTADRLSPDAPVPVLDEEHVHVRPGGAGLAAALAVTDSRPVTLVTALAADGPGMELRRAIEERGIEIVDLGIDGPTPEKVRLRAAGRSLMRLDRGGPEPGTVGPAGAAARAAIGWAEAVLVSDYGRGVPAEPGVREALAAAAARVPVVWDPHPRGPRPVEGVAAATPNEAEVAHFSPEPRGDGFAAAVARAAALRKAWRLPALCVTRGQLGALLLDGREASLSIPAPPVEAGDPCGAGDRFASRFAGLLGDGLPLEAAAAEAVESASRFVEAGGAGAAAHAPLTRRSPEGMEGIERIRAAGGTIVATGGCFDLLHAGHVRTLEAARRLGDCLVVLLNSDASVRRLKGPSRPLVPHGDRAAVLSALGCVDAVRCFDEDTPERALEELRPHVWAKGGDYEGAVLPEAGVLERWGGRAVILPYFEGRSTSRLLEEAAARA